jgi:hypothetical protein
MYVRLLDPRTGQLLREHLGQKRGGHRIRPEDRPRRTPPHTMELLARAHKAGASIGVLCESIHQRKAETGLRASRGFSTWPKSTAARPATTPVRLRWNWVLPSIASYVAIWSARLKPL